MPTKKFDIIKTMPGDLRPVTVTVADPPHGRFDIPEMNGQAEVASPRPTVNPNETVVSSPSVSAYHSTLFRGFRLSARSTYNFYVEGEEQAPTYDTSGTLEDLPRYVTLRWATAPTIFVQSKKGVRPTPKMPPRTAAPMDVVKAALANGFISPGVISTLVVDPPAPVTFSPTNIDEDSFLLDPGAAGQSAADHVGDAKSRYSVIPRSTKAAATVVNFIDPSIAGAFATSRIDIATDPLHLTVVGSLAKVIGALEVISEFNQDVQVQNPPPDFTGIPDSPSVLYAGYVIERYDMLADGSMVLARSIAIDDLTQDEFIDRQVAYAGVYSYRIRSVVQWTRTSDIDFAGISTIDRQTSFSSLVGPRMVSYYAGDWSDWSRTEVVDDVPPEPPDEVTARPVSSKGEIHVSWKMPNNPQVDLSALRLVRATSTSGKVSDWTFVKEYVVSNGIYIDRDVLPYELGQTSYIYALYSVSYHQVISALSDQVEVRLSPQTSREEFPVVQIAPRGADPTVHASARLMINPNEIKANRRLTFYCRSASSGHPLRDSMYLVEVRSLSTGERSLVKLDVDATDIGVEDA